MLEIYNRRNKLTFRKVTQEKIDAILDEIRKGGTRKHSSEAHGISYSHFAKLVECGEYDLKQENTETFCAKMVEALRRIELDEQQGCRQDIKSYKEGHKGAQWTLEQIYWEEYGSSAQRKELAQQIEKLKEILETGKGEGLHEVKEAVDSICNKAQGCIERGIEDKKGE